MAPHAVRAAVGQNLLMIPPPIAGSNSGKGEDQRPPIKTTTSPNRFLQVAAARLSDRLCKWPFDDLPSIIGSRIIHKSLLQGASAPLTSNQASEAEIHHDSQSTHPCLQPTRLMRLENRQEL